MARSNVEFVLSTASTGQETAGNDHISGLCFYGTAPGSFATTAKQAVFSVPDAEEKGITLDYADETKATGTLVFTAIGAVGDKVTITATEQVPVTTTNPTGTKVVTLCTYTQAAGDTTEVILAASVAAAINARSYLTATAALTGYTASAATGTLTVVARQGLGVNLNTSSMGATITGTITLGTNTAFSGGIASKKALWHYQVSEFFRGNGDGVLWISFKSSADYSADVISLQNAAEGAISQAGVFDITATSAATFTSNGTLLQAQAASLFAAYTPLDIVYAPNIKAITDLSTLENQQVKNNYYISLAILQDGAAAGAQLYLNSGVSVTNVGLMLGIMSKAKVNQDIGEIGAFNITDDTEMAVPALANGQRISALASTLLDQLDAYRYIFATKQAGISGTFFVNDWSACNQTSPYYRISRTRTMNKAVRLINTNITPLLKSRIKLNSDGTMRDDTIATFGGAVIRVQTQMSNAEEISNMKITINSTQNVNATGKVKIGVGVQPTLTADFIEVDMSFVPKI